MESGLLSPEQLHTFEERGWVSLPGFFSPAKTAEILEWMAELEAMPEKPGRNMVYYEDSLLREGERVVQRIEHFCPNHAGFDTLVRGGSLFEAVSQVLGGTACLFKDKVNFKMPGGAGFEPHQDQQAGWSKFAPLFVTALVCVDQATPENGCLEMADCARLSGLIGEEWKPLTGEEMSGFSFTSIPTEPGDVLLFDSYVPHQSRSNLTAGRRRLLYLTYNLAADGDHRSQYFDEKRKNFPPDIERNPGKKYEFRV